jgi:hypothetical protein
MVLLFFAAGSRAVGLEQSFVFQAFTPKKAKHLFNSRDKNKQNVFIEKHFEEKR